MIRMATDSPMSNFNRKNPYVIQVKQKYEILMRKYEDISKSLIILNGSLAFILILNIILSFIKHRWFFITCIWTPTVILMSIFINRFYILNTIKDEVNTEIDKLVTMESNEVIKVNLEFVQELLYKVCTCIGKVEAYSKWFYLYNWFMIILTAIIGIGIR